MKARRSRRPIITAEEVFRRALAALGPYRETLILVGGFARDLYRHVPGFAALPLVGAPTHEVDFAVRDPLRLCGDVRLHERLIGQQLWCKEQSGLHHTTVACRYYPSEITDPTLLDPHVEFITPLRGPDRDDPISRPQHDKLHAIPLRYVDHLLERPITVNDPRYGTVQIPHPLPYIIQKNLIRRDRQKVTKQAKDQADAFYVLINLRTSWQSWRERWDQIVVNEERHAWLRRVVRQWDELYQPPRTIGAEEVVNAYGEDQTIANVCEVMAQFRATVTRTL